MSQTRSLNAATQSRLGSFIETCINTAIGLVINVVAQELIFPLFGLYVTIGENLTIAAMFTVISIARGYVIRRWFNAMLHRAAERMAARIS